MRRTGFAAVAFAVVLTLSAVAPSAQLRQTPVSSLGPDIQLGLMLRQLGTTGIFMMATAHPDDENNGLLALLKYRGGIRTTLVSATRGDGGQNEIGPELFEALAVLRTEELLAAHRFDGAEQYFTRAVDFGNSFSIQETFDRWGREEILGDFVRMIRTLRPDVITTLPPDGEGGGQHHQASAILATEAFRMAADPSAYPEQIAEGLRPWQSAKIYQSRISIGQPPPADASLLTIDTQQFDPLIGRTYAEIGALARSMHKCQGMPQVVPLPGEPSRGLFVRYALVDSTVEASGPDASLFDGVETSIEGLARFAGGSVPAAVTEGLAEIASQVEMASAAYAESERARVLAALAGGLRATRSVRGAIADSDIGEEGRFEIDFRLALKERQFQDALLLASRVRTAAVADDQLVVGGQQVGIEVVVANQGEAGIDVEAVEVLGIEGTGTTCAPDTVASGASRQCAFSGTVPAGVPLTSPYFHMQADVARYAFDEGAVFGLPFQPTPFRARIALRIAGQPVESTVPVEYRYGDLFGGEKRTQVIVVPAFSVRVTPGIAIVPADVAGEVASRDVRVTVINGQPAAATGDVVLETPDGWTVTPGRIRVSLSREDEAATVRFEVTPPAEVGVGSYPVRARVTAPGGDYDVGYQVVEYPHIHRRHLVTEAATLVKVVDVQPAPGIEVGYVMGVGDQVPQAIEQLGADVTLLDAELLAWGDLDQFDVIVTGVRAYERRADLRANNNRLLAYARAGGTVIVQYNKFEFNDAQYGPYPAEVSSDRVTDEAAPITILEPDHPVFNVPNRISSATWDDWVQERGLYFLGERDERYVDLLESADPFPYNSGTKRGALVEARVGEGRWLYVGLGLWRQLPAGTPGAYQLMANLISLGASAADPTAAARR